MGKIKQSLIDQVIAAPPWKFKERECKRRKYTTQQAAVNSSFAIARSTSILMTTPEFCYKCRAWHTRSKA